MFSCLAAPSIGSMRAITVFSKGTTSAALGEREKGRGEEREEKREEKSE